MKKPAKGKAVKPSSYKSQRAAMIIIGVLSVAAAITILLTIFRDNIVFFYSPTETIGKDISPDRTIRIGGMVKEDRLLEVGTLKREFIITDYKNDLTIRYEGIVPDLFRVGQGVVAEGRLRDGIFYADQLLAKHDENYMPREVKDALKKSGYWKENRE